MYKQPVLRFRAWDGVKMYYQGRDFEDVCISGSGRAFPMNVGFQSSDNWELMRFTELTDRDGREIYEGDLIKLESLTYRDILLVSFERGEFVGKTLRRPVKAHDLYLLRSGCRVVGNVFENPELLAGEAQP